MADLYQKALESERKSLWAFCRLRGLAKDTPERQRIAQIDEALRDHAAKKPAKTTAKTSATVAKTSGKGMTKPRTKDA